MPTASVNGTEIWYEAQGAGHPLMLFPGLGMDHQYYRIGEPLLRECCTTVLIDPRGVGRSRKDDPSEVTYTPELWADDFAALARELGYDSVDVLGSSLGGSMAQAMAVRHPDLVRSMFVIGGFSEREHIPTLLNHLMAQDQPIRLGAKRGAMWDIGQVSQRRRWADLAHRRPDFRAR